MFQKRKIRSGFITLACGVKCVCFWESYVVIWLIMLWASCCECCNMNEQMYCQHFWRNVKDQDSSRLISPGVPGRSRVRHPSRQWHLWRHGLAVLYLCYTFAGVRSENEKGTQGVAFPRRFTRSNISALKNGQIFMRRLLLGVWRWRQGVD